MIGKSNKGISTMIAIIGMVALLVIGLQLDKRKELSFSSDHLNTINFFKT